MDTREFVTRVRAHVIDVAIQSTAGNLQRPPGRKVSAEERSRSEWFNGLPPKEAEYVRRAISDAAEEAIFQLFAVLDRSRVLGDEDHFELYFVKDDHKVLLNELNNIGLNEVLNTK